MNTSSLIQKVWNFCHTLRDDGVGYGDYLEQLTYLLFLKMAHEYAQEPYLRDTHIPKGYDWPHLKTKVGEPLEAQDPTDEPASVLLARIRAERVERDKSPKARKPRAAKESA